MESPLPSGRPRPPGSWSLAIALVVAAGCGRGLGSGSAVDLSCRAEGQSHRGEATYYDFASGGGACSFDPTPGDLMVGAMNAADYAGSAACGACVRLQGPQAEITIRVVDLCPECPAGDIDLSPEAFGRIAALSAGRVPINWQYVPCETSGPIQYHFKDGSNPWWTAVQLRNHRNRVARLEYSRDGTYREVHRTGYNYFVEESGMGPGPYALRVTDIDGHVLEDTGIPHVEDQTTPGAAQFATCAGQ